MRIGFIIDAFDVGGSELNAIKVAEGLARESMRVTVFHMHRDGKLRERYERIGAELVHVPLRGFASRSFLHAIRAVRTGALARNLQVLHSHCVYSNILGAAVRRSGLRRMPLLASRRWTGFAVKPSLHTINAYAQNAADAVLVNSPSLLRRVQSESRWSNPVYVPNVIPDTAFRRVSTEEQRDARTRYGLPAEGLIVGYIARLEPVKDHRLLLDAWKRVLEDNPPATLAIIGDGSLRGALEDRARELQIEARVRFTGEILPAQLPHSLLDIGVLSSSDEGFPNSLLEAMAQHKPVVSTNVGGVPDLVEHDVNGLLVPHGDAQALSAALTRVLTDESVRERLATAADVTVNAHRESVVMQKLLSTYGAIGRI
ncbi:MAG: glycosyltransferase family 4 protein [Gemmatimonas sp.]